MNLVSILCSRFRSLRSGNSAAVAVRRDDALLSPPPRFASSLTVRFQYVIGDQCSPFAEYREELEGHCMN